MSLPVPLDSTNSREHRGQLARAINALRQSATPRTVTTVVPQSATTDIFTFRDSNNIVLGTRAVSGFFHVNTVDQANAGNALSAILSFVATGNGASDCTLTTVSQVTRGTPGVGSFGIAADGAGGAAKLQAVTPATGKTLTATVTFLGQVL